MEFIVALAAELVSTKDPPSCEACDDPIVSDELFLLYRYQEREERFCLECAKKVLQPFADFHKLVSTKLNEKIQEIKGG
jgi:hypothetical protein